MKLLQNLQKMKNFAKSKLMYITFVGFFVVFSFSAYNYNMSVQKKHTNLDKKSYYKAAIVHRALKLSLNNEIDAHKALRRYQRDKEYRNFSSTEYSANFTDGKKWEIIQQLNKMRIRNECKKLQNETLKIFSLNDLNSERFRLQNFLVDDQHKAIYCYIPKVACTQWKRILMVLTGQHHTDDPESILSITAHYRSGLLTLGSSQFKEEDITDRLQRYKKFLIVRHPLERLLSAYRDKFQGTDIDSKVFQKFYAPNMMKFSGNNRMSPEGDGSGMKFQEFLYYLAYHDPVNFQEHWKPYFYLCHPCAINYDYIGKFENLEADSNNILKRLDGLPNISFPSTKLSYTKTILKQMINDIPSSLLEKIKEVYLPDFRLFGYS